MRDEPGLDTARALLIGLEVCAVSFVQDWLELVFEDEIRVAAFTNPRGIWAGRAWSYPVDLRPLLNYIHQSVVDFQLESDASAELTFTHDNTLVVPLDDGSRNGPEALQIIGPSTNDEFRRLWIW